jgi:acyl phosphate:glycerol-3-phosphate acyltransferase
VRAGRVTPARRVAFFVGAYLIGSVPSGLLVARSAGVQDIRQYGSGNIGATNVLRTLGWRHGLAVLALDAAKGSCGVLLARWAGCGQIGQTLGGLAAMVGHLWPCTLRFHGGRGVATSLGLMLVLNPLVALLSVSVFVGVVAATRYVSLGSMTAALSAVLLLALRGAPARQVLLCALGAAAIVWRHRPNIARLLNGAESRFSWRGGTTAVTRS